MKVHTDLLSGHGVTAIGYRICDRRCDQIGAAYQAEHLGEALEQQAADDSDETLRTLVRVLGDGERDTGLLTVTDHEFSDAIGQRWWRWIVLEGDAENAIEEMRRERE